MATRVASCSYNQEFMETEPFKRRGPKRSTSKYFSPMQSSSQCGYHSLREEMQRHRALCVYERYKQDCDEYEKEQSSLRRASKSRSTSSKQGSSKKCLDNQDEGLENFRIESKLRESMDKFERRTEALIDDMMERLSQVLDSHLEQLNHVPTGGNKGKIHPSPSLIEEPNMNELQLSHEHELDNENQTSCTMSEQWSEKNGVGKGKNNLALVKSKKEELAVFTKAESVTILFANRLTCVLFSTSSFVQVTQSQVELIMACSIPKSLGHFASFHGIGLLGTKSLWYQFMEQCPFKSVRTIGGFIRAHLKREIPESTSCSLPMCQGLALESQVESIGGRNIEVSKGVFSFKSRSTPSYHLANNVPLVLYPISELLQVEGYFVFIGCNAVHNFPTTAKDLQPDFVLIPAASGARSCFFTCPKASHHELTSPTPTCANSCDSYGVHFTSLLPLMSRDNKTIHGRRLIRELWIATWKFREPYTSSFLSWRMSLFESLMKLTKRHLTWLVTFHLFPTWLTSKRTVDIPI